MLDDRYTGFLKPNISHPDRYLASLEKKEWNDKYIMMTFYIGFGLVELIISIILILESNGHYIGGIYLGALAVAVCLLGWFIHTHSYWLCNAVVMTIVSVVSAVLQGLAWKELSSVKACAIYTDDISTSCTSFPNHYNCYGDTSYRGEAMLCAFKYKDGKDQHSCNCIDRVDSNSCLVFKDINNCEELVNTIPTLLLVSFIFAILLAWVSVIITYRMDQIYRKRRDYRPPKPTIEQTVEFVLDTPLSAKLYSKP